MAQETPTPEYGNPADNVYVQMWNDNKFYVLVTAYPQGAVGPYDTIEEAELVASDIISKMELIEPEVPPVTPSPEAPEILGEDPMID